MSQANAFISYLIKPTPCNNLPGNYPWPALESMKEQINPPPVAGICKLLLSVMAEEYWQVTVQY